jgi:DNA-binding beta-propeller fold protein YncE
MSDSYREGIVKISADFKRISLFASVKGSRTTGLAAGNERIYCVDTLNHRVLCFNLSGDLLFTFGQRGVKSGQFNYPTHIAYKNHELYVVDAMNFRVQVFTESGVFLRKFGRHGDGGGNFSKPKGIAVDNKMRIFVTDVMFDNVQIFNTEGDFLYVFGVPGNEEGQFWMPFDVDIYNGKIYVADTYNKRIQIFKIEEGVK